MYKIKDISEESVEEFISIMADKQATLMMTVANANLIIKSFVDIFNKTAYRQNLLDQNRDPEDLDKEIDTARDEVNTLIGLHENNIKHLRGLEKTIEMLIEENNLHKDENATLH